MSRFTKILLTLSLLILVASSAINEFVVDHSSGEVLVGDPAAEVNGVAAFNAHWLIMGVGAFLLGILLLFGTLLSYVSDQRRSRAKGGWRL